MRKTIIESIKQFCADNAAEFLYDIVIGPRLFIAIKGPADISNKFDEFLTTEGIDHSEPGPSVYETGEIECYIECQEIYNDFFK